MNNLQMVDTTEDSPIESKLDVYWREKYDRLREDTCAQTIRSLRSQLTTIKALCVNGGEPEEALRSVLFHARLGLEISR